MNSLSEEENFFHCQCLSIRLEQLAENFLQMAILSTDEKNADIVIQLIRKSKAFLELTAIDLDVESAFELAQIQRQLSQWHIHGRETWSDTATRQQISIQAEAWARRVGEMGRVLA
jgi:hypothetical protein